MTTHLSFIVAVCDSQKTLGKENLEFLDKEIFRVIYTDESAYDICWLVRAEVCCIGDDA